MKEARTTNKRIKLKRCMNDNYIHIQISSDKFGFIELNTFKEFPSLSSSSCSKEIP